MAINVKQKLLVAKKEVTYGVDASPAGTDAVDCRNIQVNYSGDLLQRDTVRGSLSPVAPVLGKRMIEVSFECDLRGSGSQGVAPEISALLQACGFTETINGGSSIVYTPASQSIESATIKVYENVDATDSRIHTLLGCRGTCNFTFEAGRMATVAFNMKGKYSIATDNTSVSGTFDSTVPPVVESSQFTINGDSSLVIQSVTMDMANDVVDVDDINTANALKEVRITGRRPTGQFNPEAVTVASYDWWTDWVGSTQRALSMNVGSTNYNKLAISCPKVTIDAINEGDLNGIRTDEIPFNISQSTGDDEITITYS